MGAAGGNLPEGVEHDLQHGDHHQKDDLEAAGTHAAHEGIEREARQRHAEEGEHRARGADRDAVIVLAEQNEGGAAADGPREEGQRRPEPPELVLAEAAEEQEAHEVRA